MKSTALCYGAATIITGFATGAAGAFGISLSNETKVELKNDGEFESIVNGEGSVGEELARFCVERTLNEFGMEYEGASVNTQMDIPQAMGLKSSSIAANCITLATVGAIAREKGFVRQKRLNKFRQKQLISIENVEIDDERIINLGIDAAFDANVTKTGAIDDASASFFGGYSLTQNLERKIVQRGEMEELDVLIYLPGEKIFSGSIDVQAVKMFAKEVDMLWDAAKTGNIYSAITLNGLIHSTAFGLDTTPAILALKAGAICSGLTGTGPAIIALCRDNSDDILNEWDGLDGEILKTTTNNKKAMILK